MKVIFSFIGEITKIVVVALLIVLPIRYFLVQPFFVRGESMEPNFYDKEYLLVDEISYRFTKPQRGEVIVFRWPRDPSQYYIKRIIGLPGEKISARNGKMKVISDDNPEGLILEEAKYLPSSEGLGDFDVNELKGDEYFLMGDNRPRSSDSRRWGAVESKYIVGKVWLVVWPFPRAQAVSAPQYN